MEVCLRVLVEVFWGCKSLLVDDVRGSNAERVLGQELLATSAVGSYVNDVDLIALVKVVGSPTLTIVRRVQPFCACVDACGNKHHWVRLVDFLSRRQLLNVELVAPHLLAGDAGVDIATTYVKGVSLVCGFSAATLWADAFGSDAVAYRSVRP